MSEIPPTSEFAKKVAEVAIEQHKYFGLLPEHDEKLRIQILKHYFPAANANFDDVTTPWAASFVCFCVRAAGATAKEFKFAPEHSIFVYHAINFTGAFQGVKIIDEAVRVGDILQNNRGNTHFDFEFAKAHDQYPSHTSIVIRRDKDAHGKFAEVIGGNENNTIRRTTIRLNDNGTVVQRDESPFICLLKNRK